MSKTTGFQLFESEVMVFSVINSLNVNFFDRHKLRYVLIFRFLEGE